MLRVINGQDLLDSDIEKIKVISNNRCTHDYHAHFRSYLISKIKSNGRSYTIYLGDDWYFVFKQGFRTIELEELIASVNITPKRNAEMLKALREVFFKYKSYTFISVLRHDTTYRLLEYLMENDYVTIYRNRIYSTHPDLNERDQLMKKVRYCRKIDETEYKYIMHSVIFRLKRKFKVKKLC